MDITPKNLFPTDIRRAAKTLFGLESLQPVLLKLLPTPAVGFDPSQFDLSLAKLLTPNEIAIFERYKLPKRRTEYLTGRICAKMAIANYLTHTGTYPAPVALMEIEIDTSTNGRPFASVHQPLPRPVMDISIAHSGDYGIALATKSICGIDIQHQAEALLRVKNRYCTESEDRLLKDILPNEETITKLTLLWAAKEAAKKALSCWWMPGFLDLKATALEKIFTNTIGLSLTIRKSKNPQVPKKVTVVTGKFGNYGLAICLINKDPGDA